MEYKKMLTEYKKWTLYHGTSIKNAEKIKKQGADFIYVTRDLDFAKGFGQAVLVIEKGMVYINRTDSLGNDIDEATISIKPDEIKRVLYFNHKPKYHNQHDYFRSDCG